MSLVDELLAKFQVQQDAANAANEQRYQEGLQIFDRIIGQYETGGTFEKATEASLARGEKKAVASGTQSLVTSGLASTTTAAGLSKKYQEEVGDPARARAADVQAQRTGEALSQKAGFIERREDIGPSFSDIASLAKSIGAGQQASYRQPQQQARREPTVYGEEWGFSGRTTGTSGAHRRHEAADKTAASNAYFERNRARPSSGSTSTQPRLDIKYQEGTYGSLGSRIKYQGY